MKGRNPTVKERRWMDAVRELGCIICRIYRNTYTPAAIHHIDGKTKPGAHRRTIPLCDCHHQHKDNEKPPRWISRHGDGKRAFERQYVSEAELLAHCEALLQAKGVA